MTDPFEEFGLEAFFRLIDSFAKRDIMDTAARIAPDHIGLAELLANLRHAKDVLADAAQYVEDELIKAMPHKEEIIDGIGEVSYHTGAKRTGWDKEALIPVATHAIARNLPNLIDPATGEVVDHIAFTSGIVNDWCALATPNWKVTGLRAVGINPDEFCEVTWGRKTVDMPKQTAFIPMPHVEGTE